MSAKVGDRAIYRPRVPYGRQSELFCFIVRIVDADRDVVDLIAFPAGGEFQHVNGVARKSDAVHIHCWEPHASAAGDAADLLKMVVDIEERVAALEAKRSRKAAGTDDAAASDKAA